MENKDKTKTKSYLLRLPEDKFNKLEEYCERNQKVISKVIRNLIEELLNNE